MGGLIELVSGQSLGEYMKENIFEPLGMKNTFFGFREDMRDTMAHQYNYDSKLGMVVEIPKEQNFCVLGSEYESGGGGLISCVDDYVLLADALTHLGVGKNGNRILSESAVNLMRKNQLNESQLQKFWESVQFRGYGYGFGVRTNIRPEDSGNLTSLGEFGWDGARLCYLLSDPEKKVSIFHAEHMGAFHSIVEPKIRNLVYSALDYD